MFADDDFVEVGGEDVDLVVFGFGGGFDVGVETRDVQVVVEHFVDVEAEVTHAADVYEGDVFVFDVVVFLVE